MSQALRLYLNRQLLKTEEFKTQSEWEASLGDDYTIKRGTNEDGSVTLMAYGKDGKVLGSFVIAASSLSDKSGAGAGTKLESRLAEAVYTPEDATIFRNAVYKIAATLDVPWRDVYYRFTLDPDYYTDSYDEEAMLDAEYGLGVSDAKPLADQFHALQQAYGLVDEETRAIIDSEKHWQNQFNNEGNENAD